MTMIAMTGVFVTVILLILSALFSSAETTLVAMSPEKIKALAIRNPNMTRDLSIWSERPQELHDADSYRKHNCQQ